MSALWSWLMAHGSEIVGYSSPLIVAVIDYIIGKNPNSAANGMLHAIELMLKGKQQPPAPPAA